MELWFYHLMPIYLKAQMLKWSQWSCRPKTILS